MSLDDARRLVEGYVEHYNNVRLNSAIGYIMHRFVLCSVWRPTRRNTEMPRC